MQLCLNKCSLLPQWAEIKPSLCLTNICLIPLNISFQWKMHYWPNEWTQCESLLSEGSLCCLVEYVRRCVVYWYGVLCSREFFIIETWLFYLLVWILIKPCINLHMMPTAAVNHFLHLCIIYKKSAVWKICYEMTWTGMGDHIVAHGLTVC